jgi:hypothetical protein
VSSSSGSRVRRAVLPEPVSLVHAATVLLAGFLVEGGTEAYQFLERGSLAQGWPEYYTTLVTTVLGFYLMFLGTREWYAFRPGAARGRRIPWPLIQLFASAILSIGLWTGRHIRWVRRRHFYAWVLSMVGATGTLVAATVMVERSRARRPVRPVPWTGLSVWAGGTAATTTVALVAGTGGLTSTPIELVGPVGGLVVLAFGVFFLRLRRLAAPLGSLSGRALGWAGFAWSIGVAVVAGYVVGIRAVLFLSELVTNWGALVTSLAPAVVAISPLFVAYGLLAGTYWQVRSGLKRSPRALPVRGLAASGPAPSAPP